MNTLKQIYKEVYDLAVSEGNEIHHSDKDTNHTYIDIYEKIFAPFRDKTITLVEIGVNYGYSMLAWQRYFTDGIFYGIDIQNIAKHKDGYNYIVKNINDINEILNSIGETEFDIVIDDGSHGINEQLNALKIFYPRLKNGGLFIIEDIQNIDETRSEFEKYNAEIYDNRKQKNRWDDVLVVIRK